MDVLNEKTQNNSKRSHVIQLNSEQNLFFKSDL